MTTPGAEHMLELVRRYEAARRAIDQDDFETASRWLASGPDRPTGDEAPAVLRVRAQEANRRLSEALEHALDRTREDLARVRRGRRLLARMPAPGIPNDQV